jgi:uncharacterized protein
MLKDAISRLDELVQISGENLTHFFIETTIANSAVSGKSRVSLQDVLPGQLVAIVGGLLVDDRDSYLAMPIGLGLYLHQINNDRKGTVNHSCEPNCRIQGFNRLVAKRAIATGEELTIDYGTVSIGKGGIIISDCTCGAATCRHTIRSDDYKRLDTADLCIYGRLVRQAEGS